MVDIQSKIVYNNIEWDIPVHLSTRELRFQKGK
jgi:hypothetical protein